MGVITPRLGKRNKKNIDAWAIRASGDDCHLRERSDRLTDRLGIRKTKSKSHLPRCCFFLGAPSLRLFIYAGKIGKRVLTPFSGPFNVLELANEPENRAALPVPKKRGRLLTVASLINE